jgi:chemotaxis-related protein WspB
MLFILFQLDQDRYAIESRELVEILPLMRLKRLPHAPTGVAGILDYRGVPVPVIDLSEMALGRRSAERLSTRILIVQSEGGQQMGLIAERANGMLKCESTDFVSSGINVGGAPYLGPVTRDARGIVQWISPEKLLSAEIRNALLLDDMKEAA